MRTNARVEPMQIWRASDPRRLSAFTVIDPGGPDENVMVHMLYPPRFPGGVRFLPRDAFQTTGSKGYTRVS